ncbi:MAG: TylF/MycF/NovP-related O-methyltransferase [Spirochaetaceae bacterium]
MASVDTTYDRSVDLIRTADYLRKEGFGIISPQQYRIDIEEDFYALWREVERYTMISLERGYSIYRSVEYIVKNDIPGSFVECGVWKGGASMLMALSLRAFGGSLRRIYLYDTFAGMTAPTEQDRIAWNGSSVSERWERFAGWAIPKREVIENFSRIDYPLELILPVQGKVENTLRSCAPDEIALLRLDTDWYESTAEELKVLYPRLQRGGVLLIDDYGHFTGARKAVDEYFSKGGPFLHRDDYTGRSAVKVR